MIHFLLPAALLAAAGILVPLLLHLWRPPARMVRLGSLRFLETVPGRRLRDLRWRDRLLLLLRVALLLALAALLASPIWSERREGPQRWALLAPGTELKGSALQSWRDLLAAGYEPRVLAPGFPSADLSELPLSDGVVDAWSLLREAEARVPSGSQIVLFAPPKLALLRGKRPTFTRSTVQWIASSARDDASSPWWLDPHSVIASNRGFRATVGTSDAGATRFSELNVIDPAAMTVVLDPTTRTELKIRRAGDEIAVRLSGSKADDWVPVAVYRPIRVAIVHGPQRADDARFVAAAVRAVGEVSDRPIRVEVREESASTVLPESDWVFRLGATPLTASMSSILAEDRVNVVTDAPRDANEEPLVSWFVSAHDTIGVNGSRLWRRASPGSDAGAVIWCDGLGNPLLTFRREGRAERWRFFSRFHPLATDWVGSGAFPAWMRSLLLGPDDEANRRSHDRRLVGESQVQPEHAAVAEAGTTLAPAARRSLDVQAWLWVLLALLLALERVLSLRSSIPPASDAERTRQRERRPMAEVGP